MFWGRHQEELSFFEIFVVPVVLLLMHSSYHHPIFKNE
jgi:hypothetical protein